MTSVYPYPLMMPIADQSKIARAGLGWSQADLAKKAGVGLATIQRYESGDDIRVSSLVKITGAFMEEDVSFDAVNGGPKSFENTGITVSIKL